MDYFFSQMREILGERYTEFERAYNEKPRHKALRVNTLKISVDDFVELTRREQAAGKREYALKENPLCFGSFYTTVKPSLDPLYHAGLYYMQEPSASAAVSALSPYIGERVLDLCAAPGGKSTQLAAYMKGGVLFCNDVEYKRITALIENLERLGVKNSVVTLCDAKSYRAAGLDGYFDTLVVDAPCSGGGMSRYENVPYTAEIVEGCAKRQRALLDDAVMLLSTGGYMLYSTCTFSKEENEDNVRYIISKGFEPIDTPLLPGVERGIDIPEARRIYPHNFDGEGHFYCVLKKTASSLCVTRPDRLKRKSVKINGLNADCAEIGGQSVLFDGEYPKFTVLPNGRQGTFCVMRSGVPLFERDGEPSHALTHALSPDEIERFGSVELNDCAEKYLRGEAVDVSADKGIKAALYRGYALGKVRSAPDGAGSMTLKNLYPKALRIKQ
ncbi:MAG: hypothetical protein J1F33_08225 [Clostridiales bacterium]|nr:hypothetical protein [Clostridiales bacterium]